MGGRLGEKTENAQLGLPEQHHHKRWGALHLQRENRAARGRVWKSGRMGENRGKAPR